MKTIVIAAVTLAALFGTPASAADMATKAPPPAYAPASLANWAGFYIGANAGGGVANANVYDPDCFFCNDSTLHGGFAELGGQGGYNWQFGHAIIGIEGDLNWQSFNRTSGVVATVEATTTKLDAFASVRLRAGMAFDRTLAYVTFGPAWGHANSVSTQFTNPSLTTIAEQATDKAWHGGIAAGAGIEYMLAPNWAVRGEYLYIDYTDAVNFLVPTTQGRKDYAYSEQIARVGLDYLFNGGATLANVDPRPLLGKARTASIPAEGASWNGFYVGGNAGGGIAEAQLLDPDSFFFGQAVDHAGFVTLGGQAGYDAQWNAIVLGVVGDIDWASAKQNRPLALNGSLGAIPHSGTDQFRMDALASLRARIGLANDRSLFYVTAGPAWGHFNSTTTFITPPATTVRDTAPDDSWHFGLAAGAGVEFAIDPHWSVFGEYLFYNFDSKSAFFQPTAAGAATDAQNRIDYAYSAQVARVGVNYSFDGRGSGAAAVSRNSAAVLANWAGFYLGANIGGGIADSQAMDVDIFTGSDLNFHTGFAALGGQAGYNWQSGAAVVGLEADINWTSGSASRAFGLDDGLPFGPGTEQFKMDGFASLRARAGLALDRSLLYVTAGPAIGHFKENVVAIDVSSMSPWTGWAPGLAAGAGLAYKLDAHWSVRAEFLHLAFADKTVNCIPNTAIAAASGCSVAHTQFANSAEVARVGLDYSFDWGAAGKAPPLVSKSSLAR